MEIEKAFEDYLLKEQLEGGDKDSIRSDEDLFRLGIIDSVGVLRLVAFMEEEFDIEIPEEDLKLENFKTIASLANLVNKFSKNLYPANNKS